MPLAILVIASATLATVVGVATAQDRATDNELFAAYCQGVMEKWQVPSKPMPCKPGERPEECLAKAAKPKFEATEYAARLVRLSLYLKARGYKSGRSALAREAVSVARSAGLSDGAECSSDGFDPMTEASGITSRACEPECRSSGYGSDACRKCYKELGPRPGFSCRLVWRCNDDLSRLPY